MGTPIEQYNIGIEMEQILREMISDLVSKAYQKAGETYAMV
jgi:hypothetical protein